MVDFAAFHGGGDDFRPYRLLAIDRDAIGSGFGAHILGPSAFVFEQNSRTALIEVHPPAGAGAHVIEQVEVCHVLPRIDGRRAQSRVEAAILEFPRLVAHRQELGQAWQLRGT